MSDSKGSFDRDEVDVTSTSGGISIGIERDTQLSKTKPQKTQTDQHSDKKESVFFEPERIFQTESPRRTQVTTQAQSRSSARRKHENRKINREQDATKFTENEVSTLYYSDWFDFVGKHFYMNCIAFTSEIKNGTYWGNNA